MLAALEQRNPLSSRLLKRMLLWGTSPALDKKDIAERLGVRESRGDFMSRRYLNRVEVVLGRQMWRLDLRSSGEARLSASS